MAVFSNNSDTSGSDTFLAASEQIVRKVERQDCSEKKVPSSLNKVNHQDELRPRKTTSPFLSPPSRDPHSLSRSLNQKALKVVLEE